MSKQIYIVASKENNMKASKLIEWLSDNIKMWGDHEIIMRTSENDDDYFIDSIYYNDDEEKQIDEYELQLSNQMAQFEKAQRRMKLKLK